MEDILIRHAVQEDLETIVKIETETMSYPWSLNSFKKELQIDFSYFIVAIRNERIIGYAIAWLVGNEINMNHIVVMKDYRRKGVAGKLFDYFIQIFKNLYINRILLEVHSGNHGALEFYQHLGFHKTGYRKDYYPDGDAILMEKTLK